MKYTVEQAVREFEGMANRRTVEQAGRLVTERAASWQPDPYVDNVFGLVYATSNFAAVVVYLNGQSPDFETSLI